MAKMRTRLLRWVSDPAAWSRVILPLALGLAFTALAVLSLRHLSMTYDEDIGFAYGERILHLNSARNNPTIMPVVAFNALPHRISDFVGFMPLHNLLARFPMARLPTIAIGLCLAFICYRWSRELFGPVAGVVSLAVFAFEPNIIAHSRLVTTDIYMTFGFVLVSYCTWLFHKRRSWVTLVLAGMALGYACIAKYTAMLLFPIVLFLLVLVEISHRKTDSEQIAWQGVLKGTFVALGEFAVMVAIAILFINLGFLLRGTWDPLSGYKFQSTAFQAIQRMILGVADVRVPLPAPYLEGLDTTLSIERTAFHGRASFYLLGTLNHTGFKGYYLIASLFKVPLGFQILFVASFVAWLFRFRGDSKRLDYAFLLVPLFALVVFFNWVDRFDKGIRHFLPAFPLAIVFAGSLVTTWKGWTKLQKGAVIVLILWGAASTISYFPHFIPYFNELVPDRRKSYLILADSNLDWGQSEWYLARYVEAHPDVIVEPGQPEAGHIVVGANKLLGILGDPTTYAWLRDNFEPVDTIAYSYLVFDVPASDLETLQP